MTIQLCLLFVAVTWSPTHAQTTEIFNYKQVLAGPNRTLTVSINTVNRATGEVVFGGGDSRGPTTPGLTFTWVWGDGTSNNGFFPQTKRYADVTKNYVVRVIANYSPTEKDTVEVLVDFVKGKITPVALDARFRVFLPSQPVSLSSANGYSIPATLRPLPDNLFTDVSRADFEYLFQIGSVIEHDFVNGDVVMPGGKFEQYALRDSTFGGAYALWYTRPVSFGIGNGFLKGADSDFSSMYHEMAHNITLNFPASYQYGGKTDGPANAIFSEAIAQIFQHAAGYELINNYQQYGLDDIWLFKLKQNFTSNVRFQRTLFNEYMSAGMPFQTYYNANQNDAKRNREVLQTFLTVPYMFFRYTEEQGKGYRAPVKRLMQFLGRLNADWLKRYDPKTDSPAANAFRATLWVAAISHTFQRDLRADFRAIGYPVSDADWAFLNPSVFSVSPGVVSVSATAGNVASVSVTTSASSWSIANAPAWLTVSPRQGTGSQSLTIAAAANASVSSRTGVVTFAAPDFPASSVTVVQAGAAVNSCSLTAGLSGSSLTLCQGSSITLTASGSQTNVAYSWQRDGTALPNITPMIVINNSGTYAVTLLDLNNCTATVSATVVDGPVVAPVIAAVSVTSTGAVSLSATPTGPGLTYQWSLSGTAITGATSVTYAVRQSGVYQVAVSNGVCAATSPPLTVNVATGSGRVAAESAPELLRLNVSPNPSSGRFIIRLQLPEPAPATLLLTDVSGRVVQEWRLKASRTVHEQEADLRNIPAGIYLVVAESGGMQVVNRVLVE